jgi:hypothetical protein
MKRLSNHHEIREALGELEPDGVRYFLRSLTIPVMELLDEPRREGRQWWLPRCNCLLFEVRSLATMLALLKEERALEVPVGWAFDRERRDAQLFWRGIHYSTEVFDALPIIGDDRAMRWFKRNEKARQTALRLRPLLSEAMLRFFLSFPDTLVTDPDGNHVCVAYPQYWRVWDDYGVDFNLRHGADGVRFIDKLPMCAWGSLYPRFVPTMEVVLERAIHVFDCDVVSPKETYKRAAEDRAYVAREGVSLTEAVVREVAPYFDWKTRGPSGDTFAHCVINSALNIYAESSVLWDRCNVLLSCGVDMTVKDWRYVHTPFYRIYHDTQLRLCDLSFARRTGKFPKDHNQGRWEVMKLLMQHGEDVTGYHPAIVAYSDHVKKVTSLARTDALPIEMKKIVMAFLA